MGSSTDVHCSACGYNEQLLVGGGFQGQNFRPVSCPQCVAITTANYNVRPLVCSQCKSPDISELSETDPCHCPKCGAFELRFGTNVGRHGPVLWD